MSVTNIAKADPTLANRYLAQQVDDTELHTIEDNLIADPEFVKELEATARFKVGLQHLRDTGQLDALLQPRPAKRRFAIAAAMAIVLAGAITFVRFDSSSPVMAPSIATFTDEYSAPLPIASTHAVFRRRSANYDAVIELPNQRHAIQIRVLPDDESPQARYDISLLAVDTEGTAKTVAELEDLEPEEDGFVSVYADSALLAPGDYSLAISRNGNADQRGQSFAIKVIKK